MKKLFLISLMLLCLGLKVPQAYAASYDLYISNSNTTLTCVINDQNCIWQSVVVATNNSGSTLYNSKIWVNDSTISYINKSGVETSSSSTIPQAILQGESAINTIVRVKPNTSQIGTYFSRFYIDGQVCNTKVNPPDCYYSLGAGSFTVKTNVVAAPTAVPPTAVPPTSVPPSATPMTQSAIQPTSVILPTTSSPTATPVANSTNNNTNNNSNNTSGNTSGNTSSTNEISTTTPSPTIPQKKLFGLFNIGKQPEEKIEDIEETPNQKPIYENNQESSYGIIHFIGLIALLSLIIFTLSKYPKTAPYMKNIHTKLSQLTKQVRHKLSSTK